MKTCLKPQSNEDEKPAARLIPGGPRLKAALENLRNFPDMPFQEIPPPLSYYHSSRQEKHAERFIDLAADFVTALGRKGGLEKLRKQAAPFARLTRLGSRYQDLRAAAYKRFSSAFTTPTGTAGHLSLAHLRGDSTSESNADPVNWSDVEKYLGNADSVLRFPSETFEYCQWLVEFLSCAYPDLIPLGYELRRIHEQVDGTHLRGNFLLFTAHDIADSILQDAGPYLNLVTTIVKSPGTIAAAKAAAEDLVTALSVDGRRSRPKSGEPAAKSEEESADMPCLVSLRDVAPLVGRSKRTLEKYDKPPADIPGGDGKTAFWDWQTLRPWLEEEFDTKLPERFPGWIPSRPS